MELDLLRPLYEAEGPVVSVHLDTSRLDHDADKRLEVTWRDLRRELAAQGADEPSLAALDAAVGGSPHVVGPQGESLFAAGGVLLGAFTLSEPPPRNRAVVRPLADPLETVLDLDHQLPYVVVALDREGGDIDAYPAGAFDAATSRTYDGSTLHISRVRGGGPSMASYHRRSVNLWTQNASGVAAEIAEAAQAVGARVVFVGGDPKALGVLRELLTAQKIDAEVVDVPGGRGGDDALAALREAVDARLAEASRRSHEDAMAAYREALAQQAAVHGLPAVADAFAPGNVRTLLLHADRGADPAKWGAGGDPKLIASSPDALGGHGPAFEAPASTLLLRAATLTGATFSELLPGTLADDGAAALLRYTT
ncbi:baeRF2 domain-containing protein [Streptacidiphilus rugosus]|uniref:baeRF2 domain-containing protein n=1 Tax=Streptacidiphilus rugosus TaxID=405783 RepID=UPI00055ECB60|nr:Vms1/Ankzf1 family peptidyl-tRNA hydrolase [Streptacidiphilus rugosus]